ncbi:transcriptional regulator [Latilactobacillus sakei]|uniref:transcriptional regulator n=1 Tax=Latilactobacillus sakei TaxID=1599 RepID=UPI00338EB762
MRRSAFNYIEDILRDYPHYEAYIRECEQEIRYPHTESDENIGGGSSAMQQEHATATLIRIEDDRRIKMMRRQQEVIRDCLDFPPSSDVVKEMCDELYFKPNRTLTLEGVAQKLNISVSTLKRVRLSFFRNICKNLGIKYD